MSSPPPPLFSNFGFCTLAIILDEGLPVLCFVVLHQFNLPAVCMGHDVAMKNVQSRFVMLVTSHLLTNRFRGTVKLVETTLSLTDVLKNGLLAQEELISRLMER